MSVIAQRVQTLAASETLRFTARAKELAAEGRSIISLTAGEPDFPTPAHICDAAIQAIREGAHKYTVNTGTPELRKAICAKLLRDNQLEYSPEQIVVSNGAKQSIGFAILATVDPGDEVIIPAPYWVSYPEMVKLAEGVPVIVTTSLESGYKLSPSQLQAAITPRTKAVILCSPSNPTGSCYHREELEALVEVLRRHPQVLIYSDEIYEYIQFTGSADGQGATGTTGNGPSSGKETPRLGGHVSIAQLDPSIKDRTIVINGFSKGFAMTGWRLGYLAATKEIAAGVAKIQSQETSAPSTISQAAGLKAYTSPLTEVEEMRRVFQSRRDLVMDILGTIPKVKCFNPDGAFYVFPDVSAYLPSHSSDGRLIETSTDLAMLALEEFGVGIVPGDAFGEPNCVRLSFAASESQLQEGFSRFRTALSSLKPVSSRS